MERIREKMLQARLERERIQAGQRAAQPRARRGRLAQLPARPGQLVLLAGGVVLGALVVALVWRPGPDGLQEGGNRAGLEANRASIPLPLGEPSGQGRMVQEMRDSLTLLAREMQQLAITVNSLEQQVQDLSRISPELASTADRPGARASAPATAAAGDALDRLAPPAAGNTDTGPATVIDPAGAAPGPVAGSAGGGQPETPRPAGGWVINLISSPDRAAVDRFVQEAAASGVKTDLQQVAVRGKTYWRVQVGGFGSAEEARAGSAGIRERLGLKDVWIARQ